MRRDLSQWHRHFIWYATLDLVDEFGRPDTKELVIFETVERRQVTTILGTFWEYRWPS